MVVDERKLLVTDCEGNQKEMEIMFTFEHGGKNFVVYFDPNAKENENNVFASLYDDEGNLLPIEDDADWDTVEEMVNAFVDEECEEEN